MPLRGNRVLFYATPDDLLPRLADLERGMSIRYVQSGIFESSEPVTYASYSEIPRIGYSLKGDTVKDIAYLIVAQSTPIQHRVINLGSGEVRFSIDYRENPLSVIFRPGGVFERAKAVIEGSISKLSRDPQCERLYRDVVKYLTAGFDVFKGHHVGGHALRLSAQGFRLTASVAGNRSYDLIVQSAR